MFGGSEKQHMMINFNLHISHLLHHHHNNNQSQRNKADESNNNNNNNNQSQRNRADEVKGVPKGCMAVLVGHEEEEQLQRFVIPIVYINHPLFLQLLKEAEEEYGFDQKGPITIPCRVEEFRNVQGLIDREHHHHHVINHHHHHNPHHHNPHHHHNNHHHFLCFKA